MKRPQAGYVLIYVLVTALVVSVIAAGLMQMLLTRYTASQRAAAGTQKSRTAQSALDRMMAEWNKNNTFCASFTGYTCAGGANCSTTCTCTPTNSNDATISISSVASKGCVVTITTTP